MHYLKQEIEKLCHELNLLRTSNLALEKACKDTSQSLWLFSKQISVLAKETGEWRGEDNENHSSEAEQRRKALKLLEEIKGLLENT